MMEMMQRMYPNEVFSDGHFPRNIPRNRFLGIYRGTCSSEYSEEYVRRYIPIDRCIYVQKRIDR
ncbi:hypothetical protein YC2023_010308 [Brassica napus]